MRCLSLLLLLLLAGCYYPYGTYAYYGNPYYDYPYYGYSYYPYGAYPAPGTHG